MLVRLESKEPDAIISLVVAADKNGMLDLSKWEVFLIDSPLSYFAEDFKRDILRNGITSLFTRELLTEAVVPKGTPQNKIIATFQDFLRAIPVQDELIIVDPYLLSHTSDPGAYAALFVDILRPFHSDLRSIRAVVHPNHTSVATRSELSLAITSAAPNCTFSDKPSSDYHDRFWISAGRERGILTGTSLNGLGRRYALIDHLQSQDVQDIVDSLVAAGLIPT
jgi:hypothetical protein